MRANKLFTVIPWGKKEPEQHFWHCRSHSGVRLIPVPKKGYLCPQCGISSPAIRITDTVE